MKKKKKNVCVSIPTRNQMETVFCLFFYPDVMFTVTGSPSVSRSWLKYLPRGTGIRNVDRESPALLGNSQK